MDPIQILPREILGEILTFVTYLLYQPHALRLRTICKKFRDVVDSLPYWRDCVKGYEIPFGKRIEMSIYTFHDLLANCAQIAIPVRNWVIKDSKYKMKYIIEDMQEYPNILLGENGYNIISRLFDSSRSQIISFSFIPSHPTQIKFFLIYPNKGYCYQYLNDVCVYASKSSRIIIKQTYDEIAIYIDSSVNHYKFSETVNIAMMMNRTIRLYA